MLRKKTILLLLTGFMLLSWTAGCSKEKESKDVGQTSSTESEKPVTIKYLHVYHSAVDDLTKTGGDLNNNRIAEAHNKNSGITVQWELLPKTDFETKVAMVFASGDVPDLISLSKDSAFKYASQGVTSPLDELIAKYGSEYSKMTPKDVLEALKLEGKTIAFSAAGEGVYDVTSHGIIVRRDIMSELGLKDPKTLEEFEALLKTVKEKKNMIPFSTNNNTILVQAIEGAFGVSTKTVVKNGKLEFTAIQPEFKQYLEFMKKMYDEGLLDKEFAVVKDSMQKVLEGRVFAVPGAWSTISLNKVNLANKFPNAKLDFIPYPEGKNGMKGTTQNAYFGQMTCIPTNSKQKEAAIKFINYMSTEKAGNIQDYGIEDTDYKVDNGKVVQTLEEQTKVGWKILYQTVSRSESFPRRLKLKGYDAEYNRQAELCKGCILPEVTTIAPPIEKYDTKVADLDKHVIEFTTKIIMGSAQLGDFDKYVQEFNTKGGKDAIDALNVWYTKNSKK